MITIAIDDTSPVPPFEQIRAQLAAAIIHGAVTSGTRLPTVRQLAADLDVAPNTVARAYKRLEASELIKTSGRHGTTVADTRPGPGARAAAIRNAASHYLNEVLRLGGTVEEAMQAITSARPKRQTAAR